MNDPRNDALDLLRDYQELRNNRRVAGAPPDPGAFEQYQAKLMEAQVLALIYVGDQLATMNDLKRKFAR